MLAWVSLATLSQKHKSSEQISFWVHSLHSTNSKLHYYLHTKLQVATERKYSFKSKLLHLVGISADLRSALNCKAVESYHSKRAFVITVCTCASVQTDTDNWVFHEEDAITV